MHACERDLHLILTSRPWSLYGSALTGQLGDIRRDPSRFVAGEQLGRRSPAGLLLEIDIGELLASAVLHDEGSTNILDGPGRREAAPCDKYATSEQRIAPYCRLLI